MKKLLLGKCEEELKNLDDNSIDAIVTDPPYHLTSIVKRFGKENSAAAKYGTDGVFSRASKGFMGKEWDGGDIAFNKEIWKECLRVLKPGGHLVAFSATRTYHRMVTAIEDAGFEVRDMLEWIYAEGFPKSLNIGKAVASYQEYGKSNTRSLRKIEQEKGDGEYQLKGKNNGILGETKIWDRKHFTPDNEWKGWGTALKPAHEPIVLARKPLSEKTIVDNVLKYGTGALNIDECRIPTSDDLSRINKTDNGMFGVGNNNNNTAQQCKEQGIEYGGRFPANIIVTDDALNDGKISKSIKAKQDKSGSGGIWEKSTGVPAGETYSDTGSNSRYFDIDHWATRYGLIQIPKASKSEKNEGCENLNEKQYSHDGRNKEIENPYQRNKSVASNNHPTVKPVHLMAWLVQLISKKGDIVLDPFMGSGTTGVACMQLDRNFIGIEMEEEYIKIAESRIENEGSKPIQMNLFEEIIEPEKKKIKIEWISLFDE